MKKCILSLAVLFIANLGFAQTAGFLNLSPDARTMGMGGAAVAQDANAFALYNNPAAMSLSQKKFSVAASYSLWQPSASNSSLGSIAAYGNITKRIALGLNFRYFQHSSYEKMDEMGNALGKFTPREYALDLGLSCRIISGLSAGMNFRYIGSDMGAPKMANAFASDIALMYKFILLSD